MLPPPLLRLPIELHRSIIDYLEFQDKASLSFASRYFTSIIKPPTHEDLLLAETSAWAISRNLFACKGCVKFRKLREFADDMRKGKRGRHEAEARSRFCIRCGVDNGWYTRGTELTVYGLLHVLCRICGTFTDRTGAKGTCAACTPTSIWTENSGANSRISDTQDDHEDDWAYSTRSCAEGRHSEELYGVWPDA